jgi:hypothetical protein
MSDLTEHVLTAIRDEFGRQQEHGCPTLGWFDDEDPADTVIDGHVDLTALARAVVVARWQSVAKAPEDGAEVLTWNGWDRVAATYAADRGKFIRAGDYLYLEGVTHWMPLPPPPQTARP